MEDKMVDLYLKQGEIRLALSVPKPTADKMSEIRSRNPEIWKDKELDLLEEAGKELDGATKA